jgi:Rrf2 family transcriptional regulator, iron-sulfur cluster assembly transcription factor
MFFHRTTSYALRALLYFAEFPIGKIFNSGEIAENTHLPKEYISKILQQLSKYNIVSSRKGKGGGFYLSKEVRDIKLIDVVIAVEDNFDLDLCVFGISKCSSACECPIHESYGKLKEEFKSMLINYNIGQLDKINYKNFPFV